MEYLAPYVHLILGQIKSNANNMAPTTKSDTSAICIRVAGHPRGRIPGIRDAGHPQGQRELAAKRDSDEYRAYAMQDTRKGCPYISCGCDGLGNGGMIT